jgi:hypothetical protein
VHFEPGGGRNSTGGRHRCARLEAALNDAETALLCVLYAENPAASRPESRIRR